MQQLTTRLTRELVNHAMSHPQCALLALENAYHFVRRASQPGILDKVVDQTELQQVVTATEKVRA